MKKLFSIFALILAVCMMLAACATTEPEPSVQPTAEAPVSEPAKTEEPAVEETPTDVPLTVDEPTSIVFVTGGTGGAWYPIGVGMADMLTKLDNNLTVSAEVTNGGVENARLVGTNQAQFGFANDDTAYFATKALDAFSSDQPYEIYGVAWLYPSTMQICVLENSGIDSIEDLVGKKVVVGTAASSAATMSWTILASYGITENDITGSYLSIAEGAEALKDGNVDCVMVFSAYPNNALNELSVSKDIKLLSIDAAHQESIIAQHSYFSPITIPAGAYGNAEMGDIEALGMGSSLICDNTVSEAVVYNFLKGIYENLDALQESHAMVKNIKLENAINMPIEYHPGAIKFYTEMGIWPN